MIYHRECLKMYVGDTDTKVFEENTSHNGYENMGPKSDISISISISIIIS